METSLYAKRHDNKTSLTPYLLSLKTPPLKESQETKSNTITSTNLKHMEIPKTSMASLLLYYLWARPTSSSSSSSRDNRNKDRKNPRLIDANDPMVLLSPQVGCLGQIKTRNRSMHGMRKGKQKSESNIFTRCLAPLFKGNSRVQDVPRSTKKVVSVNITEMDPPLPVRMIRQEDLYKVSLWERRAGGKELQELQLTEKRRQLTTLADICFFS
jgi:hypothetical protein